jgi:hypothetical protein
MTVPSRRSRALRVFRIGACVALAFGGYYLAAPMRGTGPGTMPPVLLLVPLLVVAPLAGIAFIGLPWRRPAAVVATLIVLPALAADTQAGIEERPFVVRVSSHPELSETEFTDRWWPSGSGSLYYDRATSTLGGGD